jgi:ribosomal protein S18 acetylase RimI-like enzyme
MKLSKRSYQHGDDYWLIRAFLREVFLLNGRRELSWQAYRFDYWRWHGIENMGHGRLAEDVFIWQSADGQIGAVLNREGPGNAYLQVHPAWRSLELEEEMIATAEEHLAIPDPAGRRKVRIWCHAQDDERQDILKRRGYKKGDWPEYQRRRPLSRPIVAVHVAEGYTVRALGDGAELPARSLVSWRAFHPDEAEDSYECWEWYRNIQRAPLYRRDLDLVAVAPDGEFASFCTIWFDDVTRTGAFEPVGTAGAYQRRGLGKAVMVEGLRRLQQLGATMATVGSHDTAAHGLYGSVGFTEYELSEPWEKEL